LTGHRHGKLFISGPCGKRADNLLRLIRGQLKMVVAILMGHVTLPADSAGRRPKQCSTLSAAARYWLASAIMSLAVWRLYRQTSCNFIQGLLPPHTRHRVTDTELNIIFRVAQ
jgi:hypothetical protein